MTNAPGMTNGPQEAIARISLMRDRSFSVTPFPQERGRLLELLDHLVDGVRSVAVHDAVEGVQEVLLQCLARRIADELLGGRSNAPGQLH